MCQALEAKYGRRLDRDFCARKLDPRAWVSAADCLAGECRVDQDKVLIQCSLGARWGFHKIPPDPADDDTVGGQRMMWRAADESVPLTRDDDADWQGCRAKVSGRLPYQCFGAGEFRWCANPINTMPRVNSTKVAGSSMGRNLIQPNSRSSGPRRVEGVIVFTLVRSLRADLQSNSPFALPRDMSPDGQTLETPVSATWTQHLMSGALRMLRHLRRIAQWAADFVAKRLFLAAYEVSDDAYWRNGATRHEWRSLGGIIEFSPDFLAVSGERSSPVYLISIRAASNTYLKRVSIKVKAKKSGVIHEQQITQHRLCGIPVRKALSSIPLKPKSSKGTDWHKLGDIYIKLSEAIDSDGVDLVHGKKIADIFPSTGTDSAPHSQVERWGQYWNIDVINTLKDDIKTRYYRELVQSARQLGRPLTMRRMVYRLLTGHLGLALAFWSQNLWNAKGIRLSISRAEVDRQPMRRKKRATATV